MLPNTPEKWAWTLAEACNVAMKAGAKADIETFLPVIHLIQQQAVQETNSPTTYRGYCKKCGQEKE